MPAVNGINSIFPASLRPQETTPGGGLQKYNEEPRSGLAADTYSGGSEAWRNRATVVVGQTACQCGNCSACAAQAYASQSQNLKGEKQAEPGELAVGQEQEKAGQEEGSANASKQKGVDGEVLSRQEQAKLAELKKTDRAVRAHEQAHVAAAGNLVRRGVSLSYEKGDDGRRYAVSGEVSIDTSREADPADTIAKMRTVRAAALAPAEPSPQDRKVAAAATVAMTDAMAELQLERSAEENGENAVAQAAEKMSARNGEDAGSPSNDPGEPEVGEIDQVSPRNSHAIRTYTISGSSQPKRPAVTA